MLEHLYKFSKFSWEWQLLIEFRSYFLLILEKLLLDIKHMIKITLKDKGVYDCNRMLRFLPD